MADGAVVSVSILGPVRVEVAGGQVSLGPARQQFVLAVLALEANRQVSTDRLIDLCWPQDPPASARTMIHMYVSRLRTALADLAEVTLETRRTGYVLRCAPHVVDAQRFRVLLDEATGVAGDRDRASLLDQALDLWVGPAMSGVIGDDVRERLCHDLDEARMCAVEDRIDARLRLGRHTAVVDELLTLTAEHPHRPRLTEQLMLALYRSGRTPEALGVYDEFCRRLDSELELVPSESVRQLHLAILRNDPGIAAPDAYLAPRQLPAATVAFTGRAVELDELLLLAPPVERSTVVISAIDGMAGVGKTALAVHAAHRLAEHFPDGQLFLDLHGFSQGTEPVLADHALDQLLRALGVPGDQIPPQLDDRAALYRSRLAGKQVLVLLDNAATDAQVRPLLPASSRCLVLVTSRRYLLGLDDVRSLSLDVLSPDDAAALFTRITGHERDDAVTEVVNLCGGLPLAIRIAAARMSSRPAWTVGHLARVLSDHTHRLAELDAGPRGVAAAFQLSYDHLTADQQRMFRLLGVHPGPDVEAHAAAALAGVPVTEAAALLEDLLDAHLLLQHDPDRYQFHDLIADYARHLAGDTIGRDALVPLFDHYARAASDAMDRVYPYERGQRPPTAAGREHGPVRR